MNFTTLIANEAKLQYYEMKQYWFETISSIIVLCAMFAGLFYGIQSVSSQANEAGSLDGLVFGFILWLFASTAYSTTTKSLVEDNQKGFIEQLFLCPSGFIQLMLARSFIDMSWSIVFVTFVAWIAMVLTGNWLDINFLLLYPLLFIASLSLVGLGFIVSGLALVYKRVGTISSLFGIAFMGLVAIDGLPVSLLTLLPFTAGASLTRAVVLHNQPIEIWHLVIVLINSAVYFLVGLAIFKVFEKRAKKLNLIGQY
jgi:ABC-2 type transport system permease protein